MANTTKNRNTTAEHTASFYLQEAYYLARELERMPSDAPERSRTADETLCAAETAVLAARRAFGGMMEKGRQGKPLRLVPRSAEVTGAVKVTREGWTVIRLDTMLQNARRRTTGYIENSILELLKQWRGSGGVLPWYLSLIHISDDGKILVADCASYERSQKEWDLGVFLAECNKGAAAGGPFWVLG